MKKSSLVFGILFLMLVTAGCSWRGGENSQSSQDDPISENDTVFFYGDGCPHCAIVEEFMKKNDVTKKISLKQREIYHNKANAEVFKEKAAGCGIDEKEMGVPMLWQGGKCYSGDKDIVAYFKGLIDKK